MLTTHLVMADPFTDGKNGVTLLIQWHLPWRGKKAGILDSREDLCIFS